MIAVAPSARQWRATLLAFLLLFLGLIIALAVLTERPPLDQLPLRGVPEDEYARVGLVPVPAYDEYVAIDPGGVEFLARLIACCGRIRQIVLVRLHETDAGGAGTLTYAVNWDTSTAPESPPMGGHWRTSFTRDFEYFVTFLDAETGEHIYTLFPGSQFPWPPERRNASISGLVTVRNPDGPNVLVTVWMFDSETTVVECGEEKVITSLYAGGGPFSLTVTDARTGESLFESDSMGPSVDWTLLVRKDGVVLGQDLVSSGRFLSRGPCG